MSGVRVAAVQMVSGEDVARNLERARALIATAAVGGARLVVLPEAFACYGRADVGALAAAERDPAGPLQYPEPRCRRNSRVFPPLRSIVERIR